MSTYSFEKTHFNQRKNDRVKALGQKLNDSVKYFKIGGTNEQYSFGF